MNEWIYYSIILSEGLHFYVINGNNDMNVMVKCTICAFCKGTPITLFIYLEKLSTMLKHTYQIYINYSYDLKVLFSQVGVVNKFLNSMFLKLKKYIFWRYLNKYYSTLLSQCYYLVSKSSLKMQYSILHCFYLQISKNEWSKRNSIIIM